MIHTAVRGGTASQKEAAAVENNYASFPRLLKVVQRLQVILTSHVCASETNSGTYAYGIEKVFGQTIPEHCKTRTGRLVIAFIDQTLETS